MRRTRRSRTQLNLSLFPFLAVLICTMGVLIVLLVIVVKHADLRADEVKEQQTAKLQEQQTEIEIGKEHDEVRIALLTDVRAQVNQDLRDRQQIRSNIQSHINQLREQAEQIKARYLRMTNLNAAGDAMLTDEAAGQISALESDIAAAKRKLAEISQQAKQMERSFAIVPYHGAAGTSRRPIFVECTANAIILQPYGIELTPEDFASPLMAGNPLDAALLTIRDYLHSHGVDRKREQAYPLLIVRPEGSVGYAMARRAMKSWVDQFGYELIPANMQLTYPPIDENLRKEIERSVQAARIRSNAIKQAATRTVSLAQIANNQYGSRAAEGNQIDSAAIRSTATGVGGANESPRSMPAAGNRRGMDGRDRESFRSESVHGDQAPQDGQTALGGATQLGSIPGVDAVGRGSSLEESLAFSETALNDSPADDSLSLGGTKQQGTAATDTQFGYPPRQSPANTSGSSFALSHDANFGNPQSNGSAAPGSQQSEGATNGQDSNGGPKIGSAGDRQTAFGQESGSEGNLSSLAAQRGKDWALPDKTPNATIYRRQIFMQCSAQELRFRNVNRVQTGGEAIVFEKQTAEHVDELIDHVWRRVESWGVAGVRSYWKPQLMIEIQKGGERRAVEIQKLLEGSGLDVLLIGL